jgi:cytochrome d ubiquinol oxidase subunit I
VIGLPDQENRVTHYAIHIPYVMGLIGTRSLTIEIPGINQLVLQAQDRIRDGMKAYDALQAIKATPRGSSAPAEATQTFEKYGEHLGYALLLKKYIDDPRLATDEQIVAAANDTVPGVLPLFVAFRVMVALSMFFLLLTGTFFFLSARRKLDKHRWLLWVAVFSIPLPWLAAEMGWLVAEFGRQPWSIEGVLPTVVAVSNLSPTTVLISLIGFILIYTVLFIIEMGVMLRAIRNGPQPDHAPVSAPFAKPEPSKPATLGEAK